MVSCEYSGCWAGGSGVGMGMRGELFCYGFSFSVGRNCLLWPLLWSVWEKFMGTEATMVNKPGESHFCPCPASKTCLPAGLWEVILHFGLSFAGSKPALSKTWSDSCLLGRPGNDDSVKDKLVASDFSLSVPGLAKVPQRAWKRIEVYLPPILGMAERFLEAGFWDISQQPSLILNHHPTSLTYHALVPDHPVPHLCAPIERTTSGTPKKCPLFLLQHHMVSGCTRTAMDTGVLQIYMPF